MARNVIRPLLQNEGYDVAAERFQNSVPRLESQTPCPPCLVGDWASLGRECDCRAAKAGCSPLCALCDHGETSHALHDTSSCWPWC